MLLHLLLPVSCVLGASVAPYDGGADPTSVTTMHIIWSNHFDAGFDDKSWGLQPPQGYGVASLFPRAVMSFFCFVLSVVRACPVCNAGA